MKEYSKSLIVYFDILGFKNLVCKEKANLIGDILDTFNKATYVPEEGQLLFDKQYTNFSDTVIITAKLDGKANQIPRGILFEELLTIVHIQYELLIKKEIFIRGAITVGDIYHQENQFFGSGLIKAFELESQKAIHPRIIIDPIVFNYFDSLKSYQHTREEEDKYLDELLKKVKDDYDFVDYLRGIHSELDYNFEDYSYFLLTHKNLIIREGKKHIDNKNVLSKYQWLAKYHNDTVKKEIPKNMQEEFLIDKNELVPLNKLIFNLYCYWLHPIKVLILLILVFNIKRRKL